MIRKLTAPKIQGACVGLGGKSTKLETIHAQTRPEFRGKLVSVNTTAGRTLFLDFLPLQLGKFRDYTVRLHLVSVPGQIAQGSTRQMVLRNVDGIVLVVDSQANAIEGNNYAIRYLDYNLWQDGTDPDRLPMVVQYNKRDLPGILDVEHPGERLGVPEGIPELMSSARDGWGVFETVSRSCVSIANSKAMSAVRGSRHNIWYCATRFLKWSRWAKMHPVFCCGTPKTVDKQVVESVIGTQREAAADAPAGHEVGMGG